VIAIRHTQRINCLRRQRGTALLVGMIMLVLMTLLAISAFNTSTVNLKIVTNAQSRQEAVAAADTAVRQAISDSGTPPLVPPAFATPGYAQDAAVDVNMDGTTDYTAHLTSSCLTYAPFPAPGQKLDPFTDPNIACVGGVGEPPACMNEVWNVSSRVTGTENNYGADVGVDQGVTIGPYANNLVPCP
jgi:type II secretory pathway pseudopilin PulG